MNQYEANEKFDIEKDKLEERIQKKENIIKKDSIQLIEALSNYLSSEHSFTFISINYLQSALSNDNNTIDKPLNKLVNVAIRWQAEQDIKNDED